ncbi:hypothetical protein HDU80_008029 [Chytriomyces hyalinus]|nr:hypothetical protein HDU80_008029 [Chytriomyces hyalinus]
MAKPAKGSTSKGSSKGKAIGKTRANITTTSRKQPKPDMDMDALDKEQKRILHRRGRFDQMENYSAHEVDQVDADDDEDLDEDEAFNESDEERFGDHFVKKSGVKSQKYRNGKPVVEDDEEANDDDLLNEDVVVKDGKRKRGPVVDRADEEEEDEDEDEEEDEEDGEMMDISDLLGGGPSKAAPVNPSYSLKRTSSDPADPSNILLSKHNYDEDSDAESIYEDEADGHDGENDRLESFVSKLDGPSIKKRRTILPEATEAYTENEYNLPARSKAVSSGSAKLDLQDLVGTISAESSFTNLRKQLGDMGDKAATSTSIGGLRSAGVESAPLPTRIQDRIGRKAAFEETKKEVSKWTEIIKKNREADQLDFTTFEKKITQVATSSSLVSQFKAETTMEQEIAQILQESALDEKKQMELEDLEMNKISHEEVLARRNELAKLRSLAFYAEQKQKKIAKIKSKTYRKIHRKDAERKAAKEGGALSLEELKDLDPDAARDEAEKLHSDRIKERMTLKHKSTGKWARKMLSRNDQDDETRQALMNQLNKSHDLTRKIAGLDSDQDSDDLNDDSNDNDDETGATTSKQAISQLESLEAEIDADQEDSAVPTKGLFAMKFMQRGLEKQMQKSREMLEKAKDAFADEDNSDDSDSAKPIKSKLKTQIGNVGRMVFGDNEDDSEQGGDSEDEGVDSLKVSSAQFSMKVSNPISISTKSSGSKTFAVSESVNGAAETLKIKNAKFADAEMPVSSKSAKKSAKSTTPKSNASEKVVEIASEQPQYGAESMDDDTNPWLADSVATSKKSTKLNLTHSDKAIDKMNKVKRQQKSSDSMGDVNVSLNLDGVRKLETVKAQPAASKSAAPQPALSSASEPSVEPEYGPVAPRKVQQSISYDSDADSDEEAHFEKVSKNFVHATDISSLSQRELMQIAFANDNVANDFEEEKSKITASDAPKVVDETLPGWGNWAGDGMKVKKNVFVKVVKTGDTVEASKRKDAKLKDVIINERRMKKANKYLANDLPFGFESREQYEQAIRMPLGVEWNTTSSHSKLVAPKVVTRMGTIINPLKLKGNGSASSKKKSKK